MIKENLEIHNFICEIISPTESIDRKIISNTERNESSLSLEENFWAVSLRNSNFFHINENDYKILCFLSRIFVDLLDEESNSLSFRVNFEFLPNPYLHNEIIWKSFVYDKNNFFSKSESCSLKWKSAECNPTRHLLTKRKSISKNSEWQEVDSFFKIFNTIKIKNSILYQEQSEKEEKEADFFLNDYIPNCLEYFLKIIPGHK
jgi:hypothetical protein